MEAVNEMWSRDEAAAAMRVGRSTVDRLREEGILPTVRIRRRVFIPAAAVRTYLQRQQDEQLRGVLEWAAERGIHPIQEEGK